MNSMKLARTLSGCSLCLRGFTRKYTGLSKRPQQCSYLSTGILKVVAKSRIATTTTADASNLVKTAPRLDEDETVENEYNRMRSCNDSVATTSTSRSVGKQFKTEGSLRHWNKLCEKYPEIIEFNEQEVVRFLETMSLYGINSDASAEMILKYPPLLTTPRRKIEEIISTLRICGFKSEHRQKLLRKFPRVFDLDKLEIADRIGFLRTYFENAQEALKAVLNSVEALVEAEYVVKQKLHFLIIEMAHYTSSIKNCAVLSYPYKHIKLRHDFLIKSGLFYPIPYRKLIKIQEKEKASKAQRPKYFRPDVVVCTSDEEFLRKCTGDAFTANDLAAFEEIFSDGSGFEEYDILEEDKDDVSSDEEDEEGSTTVRKRIGTNASVIINSVGFSTEGEAVEFYF